MAQSSAKHRQQRSECRQNCGTPTSACSPTDSSSSPISSFRSLALAKAPSLLIKLYLSSQRHRRTSHMRLFIPDGCMVISYLSSTLDSGRPQSSAGVTITPTMESAMPGAMFVCKSKWEQLLTVRLSGSSRTPSHRINMYLGLESGPIPSIQIFDGQRCQRTSYIHGRYPWACCQNRSTHHQESIEGCEASWHKAKRQIQAPWGR